MVVDSDADATTLSDALMMPETDSVEDVEAEGTRDSEFALSETDALAVVDGDAEISMDSESPLRLADADTVMEPDED